MPDRLAAEVDGLRRALQPALCERLPAHVTLVPPRNVASADLEAAEEVVRRAASAHAPVHLRLGPLATFLPATPVVYLAVADDEGALDALRAACAQPPLHDPAVRGHRGFVPHVTLANQIVPDHAPVLTSALQGFRVESVVSELTLLEQEEAPPHRWRERVSYALGAPAVIGRGGLPLEIGLSDRLDAAAERFLAAECEGAAGAPAGAPLALIARREGRVVAVAVGAVEAGSLQLITFVVARAQRGQGIGGQLLAFLERVARDRGLAGLCAPVALAGPEGAFFERHGFAALSCAPGRSEGAPVRLRWRALGGAR